MKIKLEEGMKIEVPSGWTTAHTIEGNAVLIHKIGETRRFEHWKLKFENGFITDRVFNPKIVRVLSKRTKLDN